MLLKSLPTALLLTLLPTTLAQLSSECTKADSIDYLTATGQGVSPDDTCAPYCEGQGGSESTISKCLTACYAQAQSGECASVGCSDGDETKKIKRMVERTMAKLGKRATLTCTIPELCYYYSVDDSLMCLDYDTGEYRDNQGGNGNVNSGVYTYADGFVTTILAGETASPRTATATDSDSSETTAAARSATATRPVGATGTFGDAASTAASTATAAGSSGTSGAERLGAGVVVGALGLVAGLAL